MSTGKLTSGAEANRRQAEKIFDNPKREGAVRDAISQEISDLRAKTARLRALRLSHAAGRHS